jgi:hypothetical protein
MPRSPLWPVVPLLALALVGAALVLPVGVAFIVVAVPALSARSRGGAPRRGRRPPRRRAVRHAHPRRRGDGDRAVADPLDDARRRPDKSALPRDTIFSAIMIICNGAVGLCLLAGGIKHHEQTFRLEGATSALAALIALATLSLVLPTFTTSAPARIHHRAARLRRARVARALGRVRVRPDGAPPRLLPAAGAPPTNRARAAAGNAAAWTSFGLMLVALVAVIGLAKVLSPAMERGIAAAGAPPAVIGIVIALLVLLPETWAAVRARARRPLQTSLNLALGSALASIGLTIPAVAVAAVLLDMPLQLGLGAKDLVLLALTFAVAAITLGTGRRTSSRAPSTSSSSRRSWSWPWSLTRVSRVVVVARSPRRGPRTSSTRR